MSMWDIAREVTDDVIGPGAYADANEGNPDPRVQEQVRISRANQQARGDEVQRQREESLWRADCASEQAKWRSHDDGRS